MILALPSAVGGFVRIQALSPKPATDLVYTAAVSSFENNPFLALVLSLSPQGILGMSSLVPRETKARQGLCTSIPIDGLISSAGTPFMCPDPKN